MQENIPRLKQIFEQKLLEISKNYSADMRDVYRETQQQADQEKIKFYPDTVAEHAWELAHLGVFIVPLGLGSNPLPNITFRFSGEHFSVTQKGRRLLEENEEALHSPTGYIDGIKRRVQQPDGIVLTYLNEAVGAWRAGLPRASAIMLGVAYEQMIRLLAEALSRLAVPPYSNKLKKLLGKISNITDIYDEFREGVTVLKNEGKISKDITDSLERRLTSAFEHIRVLRNQSGHPSKEEFELDEAEANLTSFPSTYAWVDRLLKNLEDLYENESL